MKNLKLNLNTKAKLLNSLRNFYRPEINLKKVVI